MAATVDDARCADEKSAAYSEEMKKKMGSSLIYRHQDGMNYSPPLWGKLIVGSCLQTGADVDRLKSEGVGSIFCLQEDKDLAHFSIDLEPIVARANELGITHVRVSIPDFDPLCLRRHLAPGVRRLAAELALRPKELAYIHCTAGLGRAPGLALAYMFMLEDVCLDEAYAQLYAARRCHPQLGMIRAATCDVLSGSEGVGSVRLAIRRPDAKVVEIAGLDVGWHHRLTLQRDAETGDFVLQHQLPPGTYQYKFIVDGEWMPNMELPTVDDNGNINNVAEVKPEPGSEDAARRERIMAAGGRPDKDEVALLRARLLPLN
eukprot:TRINITY_DN55243_c1_g1_i1.p1 TRINITY_DN55243_c1_g1~~TRINITY_DN55243_c1_g1_i1.p1  ORF type:complete len:318 (+),score=77.92 TRINITY_DN55243_c1_g1_i1:54-1007(+)